MHGNTLAAGLAGIALGMVLLVGSQLRTQTVTELDSRFPVSYRKSVDELGTVDAKHGKHPSLKDAAFLAQLSSVLSTQHTNTADQKPLSRELSRTQSLENLDLDWSPAHSHKDAARTESLSDAPSAGSHTSGSGAWCHCADGAECECSTDTGVRRKASTVSLSMNCCQCDGSMVNLPAVPCADCHECGSKAFSPYYNPYGVRKSAKQRKTPILRQQQQRVWSAKGDGKEAFWKDGEHKAAPTDGMQTLNRIIAGARHFVRPPPTKDVYKVIKQTVIKKDPLVAAS